MAENIDQVFQDINLTDCAFSNGTNVSDECLGSATAGGVGEGDRDEALVVVEVSVLATVLVVIIMSNTMVLVALIRSSLIRPMSRTYFFMAHICTADLMVGVFNVLSQLSWELTYYFRGPNWLCKAVKFMQVMPLYLSSLLLTCLALDRYRAISWRMGARSLWSSPFMVRTVWGLSALLALPQVFLFSRTEQQSGEFECWGDFLYPWGVKAYVVYFVVAAFFGPMLVTVYCYTCITLKVWRYSRYRRGFVPLRTMILRKVCCLREDEITSGRGSSTRNSDGCLGGTTPSTVSGGLGSTSNMAMRVGRVPLVVHGFPNVPQPLSLAKMKTIKLTFVITFFFIVCHAPFSVTQLYYAFSSPSQGWSLCPCVRQLLCPCPMFARSE